MLHPEHSTSTKAASSVTLALGRNYFLSQILSVIHSFTNASCQATVPNPRIHDRSILADWVTVIRWSDFAVMAASSIAHRRDRLR